MVRSSSVLLVACRRNGLGLRLLALLWLVPTTGRAQNGSPSAPPRASLQQAITELSVLSARTGIAQALATSIDSQVVVLWDGAPSVRGAVAAKRLVLAQREYAFAIHARRRFDPGLGGLSYQDSLQGECIIFNAWASNGPKVNRLLRHEARKAMTGREMAYFKRHYKDGTTRASRVTVNEFVAEHIERSAS